LRLVHTRTWDPPSRGRGARFYPETSDEATAALDNAVTRAWACGVEASGVVVDAPRSQVAVAVLKEASTWCANAIVLTQAPWGALSLALWDKASREVMRGAPCPVLFVFQRPS
jgi:nucleotide-binding universal stress UspA family protein